MLMQPQPPNKIVAIIICLLAAFTVNAQLPSSSFSYSCSKDTVIECGPRCTTLKVQIPNIKSASSNYVVNNTSQHGCFNQYVLPDGPGTLLNFANDDSYSPPVSLPFSFPFYGRAYNYLTIGANAIVSFDTTYARNYCNWSISTDPVLGNLPSSVYDKASIMFPFQDIDITQTSSPKRQIKVNVVGTAPHRKWVLSFNKVPLYDCPSLIDNTSQLILHEGTGVVEVFVNSRQICSVSNSGRAIIGMQDSTMFKGIMPPGRSAIDSGWNGIGLNESWRFTPANGRPLFKRVELYNINGTYVADGDTVDAGNGIYNVLFNNVCIDATTSYVVKSSYYRYDYFNGGGTGPDSILYSTDTIHVIKAYAPPQLAVTDANCITGANGSVTVLLPVGPNYFYAITGGVYQASPEFLNLPPGRYGVDVLNNITNCVSTDSFTIALPNQTLSSLTYPLLTYCNTSTTDQIPILTGAVAGGTFSSEPAGLNINLSNGSVTPQGSDTGLYTITYTVSNPPACTAPSVSTTLRIVDNLRFIWVGAASNAWENAANWSCNNIPTSNANVFIYEGNPVINSNVTINSLTVLSGASLTVNQNRNLTVLHPN